MAPMLRKTLGLVSAGLLMLAPVSMAAGQAGGSTGGTTSPGAGTSQPGVHTQQPGHGTMSQQSGHRFLATVENIDQDDRTVQLRPEGSGDTIKLKVPEREILSGLKKGDRVQISLQKASGGTESPSGSSGGMGAPSGSSGTRTPSGSSGVGSPSSR